MKIETRFDLKENLWCLEEGIIFKAIIERAECKISIDEEGFRKYDWKWIVSYQKKEGVPFEDKTLKTENLFKTKEEAVKELLKSVGFKGDITPIKD